MIKGRISEGFDKESIVFIALIAAMLIGCAAMPVAAAVPEITDRAITDAVEDELRMDRAVPSYRIDVTTTDGIVNLSGSTDNILAKERAARIAGIVKGVRAVVNEIKVDPPLLRTDQQIREDLIDALLTDPATDSYEVDVAVHRNVVTLTGTVDSWQEKNLCETVAKGVKGVKGVTNEILVTYPEKRSVDSYFEKSQADDVASRVNGVIVVDNNLIVISPRA